MYTKHDQFSFQSFINISDRKFHPEIGKFQQKHSIHSKHDTDLVKSLGSMEAVDQTVCTL